MYVSPAIRKIYEQHIVVYLLITDVLIASYLFHRFPVPRNTALHDMLVPSVFKRVYFVYRIPIFNFQSEV